LSKAARGNARASSRGRDFRGYGSTPPSIEWPNKARVALSFVINYEAGAEYTFQDGDERRDSVGEFGAAINPTPAHIRDFCTESTFEYGSRAGVWRLARIFDGLGLKVTFHVAARAVEKYPEVGAYIAEAGHEPCAHGYRWEELWRLSRDEELKHLAHAVEVIESTCGRRPVGWHSRCTPSSSTRELLVEEGGFLYDSDAYNDDLPYQVDVGGVDHLVLPYSFTFNDMRYAFAPGFADPMDFLTLCRMGLDDLWEEGEHTPKMMSVGLHPRWAGQPGRARAVRELVDYALSKGEVWIARREDIARHWLRHASPSSSAGQ
jgi:peptidoglycan/xylan/chitin deacetylase (PgdA/CDA1 family)